jgi:hypothetical protein
MLSIIVTVIATVFMLIILKPLLLAMGAGDIIGLTMTYGSIVL